MVQEILILVILEIISIFLFIIYGSKYYYQKRIYNKILNELWDADKISNKELKLIKMILANKKSIDFKRRWNFL